MREYPKDHWQALGRWVQEARMQVSDWRDMEGWARTVGRSSRQLRGLERGEQVGIGTIEAVAHALGVADWRLLDILRDPSARTRLPSQADAMEAQARYETEVGHSSSTAVDQPSVTFVSNASDQLLLDEIALRLRKAANSGSATSQPRPRLVSDPPVMVPEEAAAMDYPDLVAESQAQEESP